ncbi:uncharacterized protein M421DRAFT_421123 [Didymella exigua CBS 183.55]|uniref:Uncharacterized protein n=1 Tax=Didymella exigua CBS 183.55 TaxID=1150837 RepID=A0A6A5RHW4_9PLEO|nr:uncharacterized protein M421DRAFT_421123 [Didymella exigua CBS 183.55]KAF1927921.1 hypothetical protein M421DRAFT_421123 [Didymella exigua CBS 183.55]
MSTVDSIRKTPSETEIANTLSTLKLSTTEPQKPLHKPKSKPVADSWDLASSGSDTETETCAPLSTTSTSTDPPQAPPPTPASPTPFEFPVTSPYGAGRLRGDSGAGSGVVSGGGGLEKRPEKTTAVAGRMIAGALGVRAPRRTEEEREYDRAMREKERKRRAEEKERERREGEEREARKKAVWDD